jgi:hypothetical protein
MVSVDTIRDPGVNLPELLARVEYDRELLCEVFDIFVAENPLLQHTLRQAIEDYDLRQIRIAARTMKGMFANPSFTPNADSVLRIERMAAKGVTASIPEELARLERATAARNYLHREVMQ